MAVVEYMLHRVNGKSKMEIPGFIGDRGHWFNSADHTYIGWVEDEREFYVPDSIESLTKEQFVTRTLGMHATNPMLKEMDMENPEAEPEAMTEAEVTAMAEAWYDDFVAKNA